MIGNLFICRNVSPSELDKMTFTRLKYWHDWHKLAEDYQAEELKKLKAKNKKYHPDA